MAIVSSMTDRRFGPSDANYLCSAFYDSCGNLRDLGPHDAANLALQMSERKFGRAGGVTADEVRAFYHHIKAHDLHLDDFLD